MVQFRSLGRNLLKAVSIVGAAVSLGMVPVLAQSAGSSFDDRFVGLDVLDGDSFVDADGQTIRVENIDTPGNHGARCPAEEDLQTKAVARLTELLQMCPPVIERRYTDDNGRLNARVSVCGEDLGTKLVDEGLASLRGISANWCKSDSITVLKGNSFIDNKEGDTVRVANMDAPSVNSPKCDAEKELGDKAIARLAELFRTCPPSIVSVLGRDPGGRLIANVAVCGEDLGTKLIGEGLAVPHGAKSDWCG